MSAKKGVYKYKCKTCEAPLRAKYSKSGVRQVFCDRKCKADFAWEHCCIICNTIFTNDSPTGKYCNSKCYEVSRRRKVSLTGQEKYCQLCNKLFRVRTNNYGRFCSRPCSGFYKTLFEGKNNYAVQAFAYYGFNCNRCNEDDGEKLIVHHKDHNRKNNLISNLEVLCGSCHIKHHNVGSKNRQKYMKLIDKLRDSYAIKTWKEKHR